MTVKTQQTPAAAAFLADRWEQETAKIVELAEALPAAKVDWTPVDGVRSYGAVLRHVAFWNKYVADSLRGERADDVLNELPAADYPTKAKAIGAVRHTAREAAAALREESSGAEQKTLELLVPFLEHNAEHYGQLVAYARLLGVVPPTSRG